MIVDDRVQEGSTDTQYGSLGCTLHPFGREKRLGVLPVDKADGG